MAGTSLGSAYVQIVPSADGIKGSITDVLNGESEDAGTKSGNTIAQFAKKALKAAAVGKVIKDTFEEGGKLQQSYIGGLETIYQGAEEQIRANARAAAEAGISMNTYAEQAVSFGAALKQSFGNDIAGAAEAADRAIMAMADNSAKMGTDIESIQNAYQGFAKQNYTMLDNLKLGYGGTRAEMERLLEDAEAYSGIHYDIDNLGDVYEAIGKIQEKLGVAGAAATEAGSTLTGAFAAVKANYQNLIGSLAIGEDIQEPLNGLITSVSNFAFNNLIPMIGTIIASLPGVIVTFIQQGIPMLLSGLGSVVSSIADSIKSFADGVSADKVSEWASTMLPKMLESAGNILGSFIRGLLQNLDKVVGAVGKIGLEVIKGLGSAIWPKVKAAAEGVKERFMAPIENLRDKIKEIVDKIKGFFSFKISAPHVPLPHFSISPAGWKLSDLLKGTKPTLSIQWYKKAEGVPYMFGDATLFGAGERNDEILYGRSALMRDIKEATKSGSPTITNYITVNGAEDPEEWADKLVRRMRLDMRTA